MKDILGKLTQLEASAPKKPKREMLKEDSNTPPMDVSSNPASLKDLFETMAAGQKPIPVVGKEGSTQQTGAGFLNVTDPALQGLGKALGDLAAQKKIQMVVPTQPGQQPAGQPQAGVTGQPQAGQVQVKEKWGTETKVSPSEKGKYEGKTKAELTSQYNKLKASGPHKKGSPAYSKMKELSFAIRAKSDWGKVQEEQLDELSPETLQAYQNKNRLRKKDSQAGGSPEAAKTISNRTTGWVRSQDKLHGGAKVPANEGAKVDRMVKHIEKSERKLGKSKEQASDIAWATANKRGMLDNKNKKKTNESEETEYRVLGTYDAKTSKGYDTRPVSVKVKAASEKEAKELAKGKLAHNHKNYRATKVETLSTKVKEADIPSTQGIDTKGAGLGAGRSATTLEGKKAKPDFLDMDKDGNKEEPMKKAIKDKKKTVKEGLSSRITAARHEGRADGLRAGKNRFRDYEDLEEARAYHEGYKDGLDECYGQGVYEGVPATLTGMADQEMDEGKLGKALTGLALAGSLATAGGIAKDKYDYHYKKDPQTQMTQSDLDASMGRSSSLHDPAARGAFYEDDMEEGNAFTAALARTPKGGKFSVGGKAFTDRTSYDASVKETAFAFEAWDNQLNDLLNEGLSVSVSKGQQNAPDSVTITAQDAEADQLLQLVKHAGLGLFGDEQTEPSSAMSIQPSQGEPDEVGSGGVDLEVVDGSDDMLSLMQKLSGVETSGSEDYADEEGHDEFHAHGHEEDEEDTNEATCNECGMMETSCQCDHEQVDEVETEDQMEFEVAEDNAPDSDEAETSADEDAEAKEDAALAGADSGDEEEMNEGFAFESLLKRMSMLEGSGDEPKHPEHDKKDDKDYDDEEEDEEDVTEGLNEWANQAGKGPGKGTEASFEQDIDFMTKVIAGGLNKPKSTGQTTVPVIAGQTDRMHDHQGTISDSVDDWVKLAGIK